ncbi:patatin-like phospholipase family protein [Casimicrobium huifangae]|jgi:predicted acylesterase/phospholipase RssA|uniref:patatin-like phospholipase family protein n=1 Tax=Casimicrobium huifangae TaxID=2591109 RepID=UPI0012ECA9C9|nr:patatin-like phospholipase family protein [Casimicrobium huifangae]
MTQQTSSDRPPIALALAGGGPLGAVYEVGALAALHDALPTLDFTRLHSYVGVSAGAFVTAGLANGITPREMVQLFIENEGEDGDALSPGVFMRPALREYASRVANLPGAVMAALWASAKSLRPSRALSELQRLAAAIPTGLFDNRAIERAMRELLSKPGRSNDFRELPARLFLIATDLDSGETVEFGAKGMDHVPISQAVQASAALPGMYTPVKIGARHYVDGALNKTLHASSALDAGAKLVICVNPLVPFNSTVARHAQSHLVEKGLPTVLSQTFRALIHSRLEKSLSSYANTYRDARLIVLEPSKGDADLFFSNLFSYSNRRRLAEHAYQHTREQLLARADVLAKEFAHYGVKLNLHALRDPHRRLLPTARHVSRGNTGVVMSQLTHALDDLELALVERG